MLRKSFVLVVMGTVVFFLCSISSADVPDSINYQGKLTTASGGCLNDTVQMTLTVYADEAGTMSVWSETQTQVEVKEGIFNVLLGSVNPLPAWIFDGSAKHLGVQVESDPEMRPLKPMVTTGYAFRSQEADTAEYARVSMPDADWVIEGDNIYHENGNVGIGTTNPSAKLDVAGNFSVDADGYASFVSTALYGYQQYTYHSLFVGVATGELRWIKIPYHHGPPVRFTIFRAVHEDDSWLGQLAATVSTTIGNWGTLSGNTFIHVEKAEDPYLPHMLRQVVACEYPGPPGCGIYLQVLGGRTYHFFGLPAAPSDVGPADPSCPSGSRWLAVGSGPGVWISGDFHVQNGDIHGNVDGTINNALLWNGHSWGEVYDSATNADIWDGHHWGDTYPYSSNSDLVDGMHGTSFLRNDQSGTLNGNLIVNGQLQTSGYSANEILRVENTRTDSGNAIYAVNHAANVYAAAISGKGASTSGDNYGVLGVTMFNSSGNQGSSAGIYGKAASETDGGDAFGVLGECWTRGGHGAGPNAAAGVYGISYATSGKNYGVFGETKSSNTDVAGVYGIGNNMDGRVHGVLGLTQSDEEGSAGVFGVAQASTGVTYGVYGRSQSSTGWAGFFEGNVKVTGSITKGGGGFKIDHPLNPANEYLSHSFVESPDMMNIYNGNVILDANGEATVQLPEWFEALNRDFRYQLTAVGAPGPNLYIAGEISGNHFRIAGGKRAMKVSWQVTGIRRDAYAEEHRIQAEEDKPPHERGKYLHATELGMPETMGVNYQESGR